MTMRRYGQYKDSGVAWLGEVPAHWRTGSLRWLCQRYSGGTPDKNTQEYWENGTIPWLNSGAVNQALITEPSTYISESAFQNSSAKWIPAEALVIALAGQGKTKGMVAQLAIPSTCNQSMAAILPTTKMAARFLLWWLQSNYQNIRNMAGGDMRDGLNLDLLGEIPCPIPTLEEQTSIASFLDRETAKIDALVEEQKRLIELLKEKRQAVISQAVTKGLDPNVPMKDSGVEWLGHVPGHWDVSLLKHIVSTAITDGPHETPNFPDEGIPFVSAEAVSSGAINFEKIRGFISVDDHARYSVKYRPRRGDIYMVKSGATTGVTAIVETDAEFNIWSPLAVIRCSAECNPYFVLNFMRSRNFLESVTVNWSFGTQQNIGMGVIENLAVPVPPIDEQHQLADFLHDITRKLDDLTEQALEAVKLLQERRAALISAAVTGKIDVRASVPA